MTDRDVKLTAASEHPDPCLAAVFMPTVHGLFMPVLLRSKGNDRWWDLPGGKINKGEDLFAGLQREVREEAGIEVEIGPYLGHVAHPVRPGLRRHFFSAIHVSGFPQNCCPDEHDDLRLMPPGSAVEALGGRLPLEAKNYILAVERAVLSRAQAPLARFAPRT